MANSKIEIEINGMTWASCSSRVDRALNKKEGVIEANVNLLAQKASIEYDDSKLSPMDLVNTIDRKSTRLNSSHL